MALANKRIAVIGGGLGGMAFMNSAIYAGLDNIQIYETAAEFTEVVRCEKQQVLVAIAEIVIGCWCQHHAKCKPSSRCIWPERRNVMDEFAGSIIIHGIPPLQDW